MRNLQLFLDLLSSLILGKLKFTSLRSKGFVFVIVLAILPGALTIICKISLASDSSHSVTLSESRRFIANASDLKANSYNSQFEGNSEPFYYTSEVEIGEAGCTVGAAVYRNNASARVYSVLHENSFESATVFLDTSTIRKYVKLENKKMITPQLRDTCNGLINVVKDIDVYNIQLIQNRRQYSDLELNIRDFWSTFR